jgi:DeoR family transcriptional regulator of aga operon
MNRGDRLNAILERLGQAGALQIADLADDLDVSPGTLRRDLRLLEDQNLLTRSRGGAVARSMLYRLPSKYRSDELRDAKRAIAKEVVGRLEPGLTIGLTGGTTTTEVARALVGIDRITVVTNALNIAGELALWPAVKLMVTGGVVRSSSYELVGPMAEDNLRKVNLDIVFAGVDGISAVRGACIEHEFEAQTSRMMMERATETVVVADRSKVGKVAFAHLCSLAELDELVTDSGADPRQLAALREAGLKVTLANGFNEPHETVGYDPD